MAALRDEIARLKGLKGRPNDSVNDKVSGDRHDMPRAAAHCHQLAILQNLPRLDDIEVECLGEFRHGKPAGHYLVDVISDRSIETGLIHSPSLPCTASTREPVDLCVRPTRSRTPSQ